MSLVIHHHPPPLLLTEALWRLHVSGKTPSWMLSGMLVQLPLYRVCRPGDGELRLEHPEQLFDAIAEEQCEGPSKWDRWPSDDIGDPKNWPQPIVNDPATEGCLFRLAELVWGHLPDQRLFLYPSPENDTAWQLRSIDPSGAALRGLVLARGSSRGEACAVLLCKLAADLPWPPPEQP